MSVVHKSSNQMHMIWCEGCDSVHGIDSRWTFNGDLDKPTFTPSLLVRIPLDGGARTAICHSFITDGKIQYLTDCTHVLAGQTIYLIDWEKAMGRA